MDMDMLEVNVRYDEYADFTDRIFLGRWGITLTDSDNRLLWNGFAYTRKGAIRKGLKAAEKFGF